MKNFGMTIAVGLMFATLAPAVEKKDNLNGTWILDLSRSDSGRETPRTGRVGGVPGTGSSYPGGIGLPGIIGGLPGGGYPGIGFPGSRPSGGGYPGGRTGRDGDDGAGGGEGVPGERMQNMTLQIVQDDQEVQTTRKLTADGEDQAITQKFTLDGSENTNPASNGRGAYVSRSSWKNNKLVNSGSQTSDRRGESYSIDVREEYSISKDGKTLTIRTTRTSPRGEVTSRQVFERQESQ
jgi:hypothetical protein